MGSGRLGRFMDPLECMQEQLKGANKWRERKDKRSKSDNEIEWVMQPNPETSILLWV